MSNHLKNGRFPSQTFLSPETKDIIDKQSGVKIGDSRKEIKAGKTDSKTFVGVVNGKNTPCYSDTAGASKSCHVCDYEKGDFDIYTYCAKTSQSERGSFNDHPTVKPIMLLRKILSYFKTPNKQIVLDTFAGSGSLGIAAYLENYDFILGELDAKFCDITRQRLNDEMKQTKLF